MNFSLIIPLYNSNYIDIQIKSINSLCLLDINLEIIFIDDWSDFEHINKYRKYFVNISNNISFKSIELLEKKWQNRVCIARNKWVQESSYENLIFIDQDTILHKNYLLDLFNVIDNDKILLWPYYWYNNNKKDINNNLINSFIDSWVIIDKNFNDFRLNFFKEKLTDKRIWEFFTASNFFIKKDIFMILWWFDEKIVTWWDEDVEFWYRLQEKWFNIDFIDWFRVLNLSEKLYNEPFNILESNKMESISNNWLYNLWKHKWNAYLNYVLDRYNNLDIIRKDKVSNKFKKFIKKINEI